MKKCPRWTKNFQMLKMDLEKAEEPEIKLPTCTGSYKKQESSRKTSTSALLTMTEPLTVWITRNSGKSWKRWEYQTTWSASCEICIQVRKQQLKLDMANTLANWCEELTHFRRSWCWERLKAGGEGDNRGWDGLMVLPTQWTWVWINSGSWWWTEKPGVLQSIGSQRVRHNWATELDWIELH